MSTRGNVGEAGPEGKGRMGGQADRDGDKKPCARGHERGHCQMSGQKAGSMGREMDGQMSVA